MNLKKYIELLNKIEDKSLPVCIADWSENYDYPSESEAHNLNVMTTLYMTEKGELKHGKFLCVGDYPDWLA